MAATANAQAQAYPSKPIRWIVPFPPGGSTDILARVVGQKLTESWGSRSSSRTARGAGGTLGAAEACALAGARRLHAADGRDPSHDRDQRLPKLPYDFQKDFAPITVVAIVPNVLVVNPSRPGQIGQGADRLCQGEPGQAHLRVGRNGHRAPPDRRAVQHACRRRYRARPLQGQRAGGRRSHRRPGID